MRLHKTIWSFLRDSTQRSTGFHLLEIECVSAADTSWPPEHCASFGSKLGSLAQAGRTCAFVCTQRE